MGLMGRYMEKSSVEKARIILDVIVMVVFILWSFQLAQSYRGCIDYFCDNILSVSKICQNSTGIIYGVQNFLQINLTNYTYCNESAGRECLP